MAALQSIRSRAGLLITVLGVALLAFILGDFFNSGNAFFNRMHDKAFSVDGEVVTTGSFDERVKSWETLEKVMSNQASLTEAQSSSIRERVYQQMVKEIMLDNQAEKLGLSISVEELNDLVYGANPSPVLQGLPFFMNPETRQFDRQALATFIQGVNQDMSGMNPQQASQIEVFKDMWLTIENLIKYQRLEEKYTSLVAGTSFVNSLEIEAYQKDEQRDVNIAYVMQPYSSIADSTITISDADVKALYEKRKNNFKLDSELSKISYFIKDIIPSEADYASVEKEMQESAKKLKTTSRPETVVNNYPDNRYVDAFISVSSLPTNIKDFVTKSPVGAMQEPLREGQEYTMYKIIDKTTAPDSVKLQIIQFPQELDPKAVNIISDSLLTVIKKGKKFEDISKEYMQEDATQPMLTEFQLIASGFPKECVYADKGEVVKTNFSGQTILVKILDKSKAVEKVKLAMVSVPVVISDKTQNRIDNELSQFIGKYGTLEAFNEAAENEGYSLMKDVLIHPAEPTLEQTEGTRAVIRWAFTEKVGDVKKFEIKDKRVIAIISNKIKDDYLPLSEVSAALKSELRKEAKAEKIISELKAKNMTNLDAYASNLNSKVDTAKYVNFSTSQIAAVGFEPIFNVAAKTAEINRLGDPLEGNNGVYAMSVVSENMGSTTDLIQLENRIQQRRLYQLIPSATMALQQKMNVEDNRVNFW